MRTSTYTRAHATTNTHTHKSARADRRTNDDLPNFAYREIQMYLNQFIAFIEFHTHIY
jgi:hypothetical protein